MLGIAPLGSVPLGGVPGTGIVPPANPPFGSRGRGAAAATILALWQPPDPQPFIGASQPLAPRRLNPQLTAVPVNDPPYTGRGGSLAGRALAAMLAQPDPWTWTFAGASQPYAPRRLSAGIPGQSADPPPFVHPARRASGIAIAAAAAQPPVLPYPESYQFDGGRQPATGRQASPAIPGQSIDPPPFTARGRTEAQRVVVTLWQPDPWTWGYAGRQPYAPARLSPGTPGQSIDNPPFVARRKIAELGEILVTWEPPPPRPYFPRYQVKFVASFSQLIIIG